MQLYFIRHGQSENNVLWDKTGSDSGRSHDPELSETGIKQVEYLVRFLAKPVTNTSEDERFRYNRSGIGLTHLYSSLMVRAVATGMALMKATGLPLVAWKDLHEGGGIYLEQNGELCGLAGHGRSFFESNFPGLILPDWLDESGWWNRSFEEREERLPRAKRVLAELLERHGHTDHRVAFISHGGFYNYFIAAVLGIDHELPAWFSMNNTGITRIDFKEGRANIIYANRLDFLPVELIT